MPFFPRTANSGPALTGRAGPRPWVGRESIEDVIREAAGTGSWLPDTRRVRAVTARLRVFVQERAYDVEVAARGRAVGDPVRGPALAAVREARYRLGLGPGDGYASAITFARSLGRAAEDLLHHERRLRREEA
ncbi:DUF6415 family natural product biosynthesis protein [Streptomyces triculaminicus]|uniref:DUF6415 family natural product biosynthesis protein n=1 Tax=Streptomyces triculaminicus TaxID=2816232 RepID=UPI0037D7764A